MDWPNCSAPALLNARVEPAERLNGLVDQIAVVVRDRNVRRHKYGSAAVADDLVSERASFLLTSRRDGDACAFARKQLRGSSTDARVAACDDDETASITAI